MSAIVVTPTTPGRRPARQKTLAQWHDLNLDFWAYEQPAGWPIGHESQLRCARRALSDALLHFDHELIIYAEDDITVDSRILGYIQPADAPISYWHTRRFHPRHHLAPASKHWFGSLCVSMTRDQVRELLMIQPAKGGIDMAIREMRPLLTERCLVRHRDLPRQASRTSQLIPGCDCYQGSVWEEVKTC